MENLSLFDDKAILLTEFKLPLDKGNSDSGKEIGDEEYPKFLRGQWPSFFWTKWTQSKIFPSSKGSNLFLRERMVTSIGIHRPYKLSAAQ